MLVVVAQQKGGVGKTTTAANVGVLLARRKGRVLLVDCDPQFALTRHLGLEIRSGDPSLVEVLAGDVIASDAIVADRYGVDVIPGAPGLAGIEMSLVTELGRELFLRDALDHVLDGYEHVVIDTPPNLGLLTVNALVCAEHVLAPVSAEDEASIHGVLELRRTISRLAGRLGVVTPRLSAVLTRWDRHRVSSRKTEQALIAEQLTPAGRIPARSALLARAAMRRIPLAITEPDSAPALAYVQLTDPAAGGDGVSPAVRRSLTVDDPIGATSPSHVARLEPGSSDARGRLREIPVRSIRRNANQPRKHFDEATLGALAESIRERGLLQPVVVRPASSDSFELVAGERRWRAARIAGDLTIPALVDDNVDDTGSLELALIENVVREDLTPIEEARTIATLLDAPNITETLLAKRLGRSRTDIAHTVRLLDLPDQAIELIDAGLLTKGHGKALLTEPDHGRRRTLARRAADEGWSVRALEAQIRRRARQPHRREPHPDHEAAAERLQDALNRTMGGDVRVRPYGAGYQVRLNQSAADRVVELLEEH